MGCVASKAPVTPAVDSSGVSGSLDTSRDLLPAAASLWNQPQVDNDEFGEQSESEKSGNVESAGNSSENFQLRNMNRCTEGEQVAAGWPSWLSSVAREAIQGWVPFKADSFEKLEKVLPRFHGFFFLIVSRQDKLGKLDPSNNSQMKSAFKLNGEENGYLGYAPHSNLKGHKPNESTKDAMLKQWLHPELQDSMYSFAGYHPRDAVSFTIWSENFQGYRDRAEKVDFSGPVLLQSEKVDEFLEKHEQHVRKAMRKSWFQRGKKSHICLCSLCN
ncbi:hypothetical protein BHE74_00020677 [Ensete ventricosum]|nr:hypothetical protein BHE74_00020677 [Ensete ventricosum]